jgi:hypothetical protein
MPGSLPRRRLLSGSAALAATAVIAAPAIKGAIHRTTAGGESVGNVVVRWNSKIRSWARRPAEADFGVVFLSTNDADATPPTDANVQTGDVWRRHPDADVEA